MRGLQPSAGMKAVVFHGVGDVRLEEVREPEIEQMTDAIVRITSSAICGMDVQVVRGTISAEPGAVLGHEGVGVVEEVGPDVRNVSVGDRVIIPATFACGNCSYCRAGHYAQCDKIEQLPFSGLQAERARIPLANVNLIRIPDDVSDEQAILLSDLFPTGCFAAELAQIKPGRVVALFGCTPVGLFAIEAARMCGAGRVLAIDHVDARLEKARRLGAEVIDSSQEDPVETIRRLTGGIGADRAIDAVGMEVNGAHGGRPDWAIAATAKAGTLAMVGNYPSELHSFPIGEAMSKNLTLRMGHCNHRRYIPRLIERVQLGLVDPVDVVSRVVELESVVDAYEAFDGEEYGWMRIDLAA